MTVDVRDGKCRRLARRRFKGRRPASGAGAPDNGGVVGNLQGGSIANPVYRDSYSTGQGGAVSSVGGGGTSDVVAVTSNPAQAGTATYAYKTGAHANPTAADRVFFDGQTRPFGAWEVSAPGGTIVSSHQLQLIGRANAAALAGSYTLGGNIDLAETGRVVASTPGSYAGMWASTGFVPLGTDGAGNVWNGTGYALLANIAANAVHGFSGSLNGAGYTMSNLAIKRSAIKNVGLFGVTQGSLSNRKARANQIDNESSRRPRSRVADLPPRVG